MNLYGNWPLTSKLKLIPKIEVSYDVYIEAQYELQPRSRNLQADVIPCATAF